MPARNDVVLAQFQSGGLYPDVEAPAYDVDGHISNSGEWFRLLDAAGEMIQEFRRNDGPPWPGAADGDGASLQLIAPGSVPNPADPANWMAADPTPGSDLPATVVDRYVFYAGSAFGGDDASIATDKTALLPGNEATVADYANYSGGVNGVMIDVVGPTLAAAIQAGDLLLATGNSADPSAW